MDAKLRYLTEVLGIRDFLRPEAAATLMAKKVVWLVEKMPHDEGLALIGKMSQAMGLTAEHYDVIETSTQGWAEEFKTKDASVAIELGGNVRGQWKEIQGVRAMSTHSIETLLVDATAKKATWSDLKQVMETF